MFLIFRGFEMDVKENELLSNENGQAYEVITLLNPC